jgi:hypothetical protein
VRDDDFLGFRHEQLPVIVQEPIQAFQDFGRGEIELVED